MPRPAFARLFIGCLTLTLGASLALARPGIVRTKTGQTYEGDVTEKDDGSVVVMTRTKIPVTIQPAQIDRVSYADDIKAQYEQRVAALPANAAAKDHLDLARWLFDNRAYDLARIEIDKAQAKDPNSADAQTLRQMVERSISWEKRSPAAGTGTGAGTGAGAGAATGGTRPPAADPGAGAGAGAARGNAGEKRLLDPDQINTIKQQELQRTDTQVRIRFDNNVNRKFTEMANVNPREFQALPDFAKMMAIFERGEPEMRKDVKIINDPQSLLRYKTRIQPFILQGCATAGCHAQQNHAGSFFLYPVQGAGDAATYTNFYILNQWRVADPATKTVGKLIDRTYPEKSLLLQFGLPAAVAEADHPPVQNLQPVFRNMQDPRFLETLDWIRNSLVSIEPNYGIDYPLPNQPQPNAQPAPAAPAPASMPNAQPQPGQRQNPAPNTPNNPNNPAGNNANDALKDARDRLRPIRGL